MFQQTAVLSILILGSLISFNKCNPDRLKRNAEIATPASSPDPQCVNREVAASFKIDCNTCHCDAEGQLGCTRKLCESSSLKTDPQCVNREVGESFKIDCNTCHCSAEGKLGCTKKSCESSPLLLEADPRCKGVNSFLDDCNTCVCVTGGTPVCTLKVCSKRKRDTQDLFKHFDEEVQNDQPSHPSKYHTIMSSSTSVSPNIWTATAALYGIALLLARI